ncbi:MAG: SDR family oxidoreductase [Saprospiraceae bacterium]|nr:SDR family oxidoreductase [Candidatus Parvibacillus calidus]MBX2936864.1 SDR family oxidoreductase [Saprospiraceae bacterium]MBX7179498.1 SDR family oxidoreductase [Saprospiraceae bacterium]MCB0590430.1 SDR family oxidoreductase [Saprospiraceae bacterium]MCO5282651.1 SDR family oxidoreductase [Saprospiraceae bacterium]
MANGLLKGKKGIIFGALDEKSLAWKVAERAYEEGASLVLTNAPVALRFGQINALAEKTGAPVIPADATSSEELAKLIDDSINHFGGKVDFVLHSIGMSLNMRKEKHYTDLNYDFMHKTLDISAISFHRILHELYAKNAVADWGSIVALTYIAAQRIFPDYNEMADAKALLESISRNFGYHFGTRNKVRVNTISQSPTMTTAGGGVKGFTDFFSYADTMSPLGNAGGDAFADYCITLFSDLTRYVTMQNLFHDGGFSSMGINPKLLGVE